MSDVERGQTLRRLRQAAGLTQRQVGDQLEIDKNSVSLWELGKTRPTIDKLSTLDRIYRADGAVLKLWGTEDGSTGPTIADLDRKLDEVLSIVRRLAAPRRVAREVVGDGTPSEMPRPALKRGSR